MSPFNFEGFAPSSSNVTGTDIDAEPSIQEVVRREAWHQEPLCILVVGASGDLAKKKTYPALFALYQSNLLPEKTVICGFARTKKTSEELRNSLRPFLQGSDEALVEGFLQLCLYQPGSSYGDSATISKILAKEGIGHNLLCYMAIPPNVFAEAASAIRKSMMAVTLGGFTRVILEKPFGRDTDSCRELLDTLKSQKWTEAELYRIDHYLGKEMVQNIVTLRSSNRWLRAIWNKATVKAVHIVFKESFGTEGRGGYFDPFGIIRDIIQNHLLQILTLVAMDLPKSLTAQEIRNAKVQVLESMPPVELKDAVLGQYDGYKNDPSIKDTETVTPTYACIRTSVNTPSWAGVPFIMEAGKALNDRLCEVRLHFHSDSVYQDEALILRLQPTPSIYLTTKIKKPGFEHSSTRTTLAMSYGTSMIPEAYTRLVLDVLRADQTSFVRDDELLQSWKIFTPLLHESEHLKVKPETYQAGSLGPKSREKFLAEHGLARDWSLPMASL